MTIYQCKYCDFTTKNKSSLGGHSSNNHSTIDYTVLSIANHSKKQKNILKYNENPKLCLECKSIIPYDKRHDNKDFCSHSCSATYKNRAGCSNPEKSRVSALKAVNKDLNVVGDFCYIKDSPTNFKVTKEKTLCLIYFKQCVNCEKYEARKTSISSKLCMTCRNSIFFEYRKLCNFSFNIGDFPKEFNIKLLSECKMFNPKNNQNGLSRDHKFSIYDGFLLKISHNIMKHPANCALMTQRENMKKFSRSSITIEELNQNLPYEGSA